MTFKELHDKAVAFDTELGRHMKELCKVYPRQTRPSNIQKALEAGERARLALHDVVECLVTAEKREVG